MENFGTLNWSIVIFYLLTNLILGWYLSKRVKSSKDYYLGDKSTPWWAIGISVMATYVSALSFLGGPAWAYSSGMAALMIHINYSLVIFICIVLFIPFFYNSGVASIYDYLEQRFGLKSRLVMATLFMLTTTLGVASILAATAIVISFTTGLQPQTAIILMATIVVIYTILGGMNAVIWTDVLQGVILLIGAIIVMASLLGAIDLTTTIEFLAINQRLNPINTSFDIGVVETVWAGVFAMTLYHVTVYGANQFMVQRALAAKTIGDAKKSYLMMGFVAFFLYFIFFSIGALLYAFYEGRAFDNTNEIMLVFVNSLAIPGLMGIIGAAILSASMSTTSSALNSLATISVTDFYAKLYCRNASEEHYLKVSRILTIVWAVLIIPVAISFVGSKGSILEVLSKVGSYLVGAKLAMFGMGFYTKRITEKGLLTGVVAGLLVLLFLAPLSWMKPFVVPMWNLLSIAEINIAWPWYVVIGGGVNIIVASLVSRFDNKCPTQWHPYSVPGQQLEFKRQKRAETESGWYLVPGRVEPITWSLIAVFVVSFIIMSFISSLS